MSWDEEMPKEQQEEWQRFVKNAREDAARKISDSAFVISLFSGGEPDIKFAVELGLSIMYDKPIALVAQKGAEIPGKLRQVADEIIELEHDEDTEAGQLEIQRLLTPVIERFTKG